MNKTSVDKKHGEILQQTCLEITNVLLKHWLTVNLVQGSYFMNQIKETTAFWKKFQ